MPFLPGKRTSVSDSAVTFPGLPPVDRRLFVPDDVWVVRDMEWVSLSRQAEPLEWERLVASADSITTKLKNGTWPISSSSSPQVMAKMIRALQLEPGMRVLEIGTGTGWNAACLAALGTEVVSVEIDAAVAEQARTNLQAAGCGQVTVVTGDGERGAAGYAPYDRVMATAAAKDIPYAWVEQCRDGALIVAPYTGEGHRWALLVLTVSGGIAAGGVTGTASFMPLRGQGLSQIEQAALECHDDLRVEVGPSGQRLIYSPDRPRP